MNSPEPRRGVRLGVDVGSVRVGLAACDPFAIMASPVRTILRDGQDIAAIVAEAIERDALEVIVGLPKGLSGVEGAAAALARSYAQQLAAAVDPIPVRLFDERLSTVVAQQALQSSGRRARNHREVIDQAAAVVILQGAIDAERAEGRATGEQVVVEREQCACEAINRDMGGVR